MTPRLAFGLVLTLVCAAALPPPARAGDPSAPTRIELDPVAPDSLVGHWEGEFRQFDLGSYRTYPMRMDVSHASVSGEGPTARVAGELSWPSLRESATRLVGTSRGNLFEFSEDALLRGSDIILNGAYRASFRTRDRLDGIWSPPAGYPSVGFGTFWLVRRPAPGRWLGEPR